MEYRQKKQLVKFSGPAIYKITTDGELNKDMSDRIGGMQINVDRSDPDQPVSVLIGLIDDQAALSGIFNTLYELHLTILNVNRMTEESK